MALLSSSLLSIVTAVGQIRIAWRWFQRVLFPVFPAIFLFITFISFGFTVIVISRQIRFSRWWVWGWWVWLRVFWYVRFSFLLWRIRWSCWPLCWLCWRLRWSCWPFYWSCLWRGFFVPIVIESISENFLLVVFVPIVVDSKGGQLIEIFWRPKLWFSLPFWK